MKNFKRISVFIAAFALVAGCASTSTQESTGQYMDDSAITAKVKAAIFNDPSLKSAEINVETFKRQVQLSAFVGAARTWTKRYRWLEAWAASFPSRTTCASSR